MLEFDVLEKLTLPALLDWGRAAGTKIEANAKKTNAFLINLRKPNS